MQGHKILQIRLVNWLFDLPRIGPYLRRLRYDKIFESLRPGEIAIDCGANVGSVTERMLKPGVEVFAFEPNIYAFEVLREKFAKNSQVHCMNQAVSTTAGLCKLYMHENSSADPAKWSSGSSLLADKGNVNQTDYKKVETIDFIKFIAGIEKPIGLIKMDIEGSEVEILNKMIDTGLAAKPRHILVETHERVPSLSVSTKELKRRIVAQGIKNIDLNWA